MDKATIDKTLILSLVKDRIGIRTSTTRDNLLNSIIDGVICELTTEKGIELTDLRHMMFIVDYSTWRYENKGKEKGMPRHLQFRLHNLMVSRGDKS